MRLSILAQRVPLAKILEEVHREGRIEIPLDARIGHTLGALAEKDSSDEVRSTRRVAWRSWRSERFP